MRFDDCLPFEEGLLLAEVNCLAGHNPTFTNMDHSPGIPQVYLVFVLGNVLNLLGKHGYFHSLKRCAHLSFRHILLKIVLNSIFKLILNALLLVSIQLLKESSLDPFIVDLY